MHTVVRTKGTVSRSPEEGGRKEDGGRRKREDGKGIRNKEEEDGRKWISSKEFYYHGNTMPFPPPHTHIRTHIYAQVC